ncbi:MAG TPA: PrsW family glutamic-type intramembrane protease [Anaerolineae bacterium]
MEQMQNTGGLHPKASYHRKNVVVSDIIAFAALVIFVAIVVVVDRWLKPVLDGSLLLVIGVVLALIPALLWMYMFYQLDSAEPEPVTDVAKIFIVGLALASAIGIPLTDQLFRIHDWLYRDVLTTALGSIFIIGGVEAFIVFATVRFFIYDEPEFDERADGVIYGTAAGLGYATALNLQFILANYGVALGSGEIFVAETALAHAAMGGLLGYFLGKAKMQHEPVWWLPIGFVVAMALNGLIYIVRGQVEEASSSALFAVGQLPSFTALLLSGLLAIVVSGIVAYLIRRDVRLTLAGRMPPRAPDADVGEARATWMVVRTFALMLVIGVLVWNGAVNSTVSFDKDGVRGGYPSYFTPSSRPDELLHVTDTQGSGAEFAVIVSPAATGITLQDVATGLTADRASRYAVYKILESSNASVSGAKAWRQHFTYVDAGGLGRSAPQILQGIDYVVIKDGRAIIATLITSPDKVQDLTPLFTRFVYSLVF